MISSVSSELSPAYSGMEALKCSFPPGSMTGAPKIRAMQLIEEYETFNRGLYSGSVGYIRPEGDFDFNVVIRSILYSANNSYLSYAVGSAITDRSDPEKEFKECMLKAEVMNRVISNSNL